MDEEKKADYIIGIDIAKDKDFSCMSGICSGCSYLVHMEHGIENEKYFNLNILKKCPNCGKPFNKVYMTNER